MKNEPIYNLLNSINSPDDLRRLEVDQLPEVCDELRQDIIKELSCNPGPFAASLGTVELTVALHYVYNTPYDRIVWDVGHQAYGHKILTFAPSLLPKRANTIHLPADTLPIRSPQPSAWLSPPPRRETTNVM